MREPRGSRGADDASQFNRLARELKEDGIELEPDVVSQDAEPILPRVIVKRPRKGFLHPATKSDITSVLEFFGEQCYYGLDTIKLVQGSDNIASGAILLGRLEVPGTILLYDLPESPWVVNERLADTQLLRLQEAGAKIEMLASGAQCRIEWSDVDLRNFYLFDVFMHEIGHHLIQQYKGKRGVRVARTRDHEHYASLFAKRCRQDYLSEQPD